MTRDIQLALRKRLADRIGADRFELWFERYGSPQLEGDVLRICAPDSFTVDWVRTTFHSVVSAVAQSVTTSPLKVEYSVTPALKASLPTDSTQGEHTVAGTVAAEPLG